MKGIIEGGWIAKNGAACRRSGDIKTPDVTGRSDNRHVWALGRLGTPNPLGRHLIPCQAAWSTGPDAAHSN